MNGKHWSEDELLDRLYGVGPGNDHLDVCAECDARWLQLTASRRSLARRGMAEDVDLDGLRLVQQREAVMERIRRSGTLFMPWRAVTAFAGVAAMVLGFVAFHPERTKPVSVQTASSDSQFFSEIYSDLEQTEPRAAKPIRRLFQGQQ